MKHPVLFAAVFAAAAVVMACDSSSPAGGPADGDTEGDAEGDEAVAAPTFLEPAVGRCEPFDAPLPVRPAVAEAPTLPRLKVQGRRIVDTEGRDVALRGVNFGSWLQVETWLTGLGLLFEGQILSQMPAKAAEFGVAEVIEAVRRRNRLEWVGTAKSHLYMVGEWKRWSYEDAPDKRDALDRFWAWFESNPWIFEELSLWQHLQRRFGGEKAEALRAAYQDAYITETDVERAAGLGLNLIRVPIFYLNLQTDYRDRPNAWRESGLRRLDNLVRWARRHKMYVLLDLHGAPGGQSAEWHTGQNNLDAQGYLWRDERCLERTKGLWRALALYFKDDPHVFGYDLLNEPKAPDKENYARVHDALYRAIREVDEGRGVVMSEDGYLSLSFTVSSPKELGWTNAMFSIHLYPDHTDPDSYLRGIESGLRSYFSVADRFDGPLFLGEFSSGEGETDGDGATTYPLARQVEAMDRAFARLNERGVHWAPWSWKYVRPRETWGMISPKPGFGDRIDVGGLDFDALLTAFRNLQSTNFAFTEGYDTVVRARTADAFAPQPN